MAEQKYAERKCLTCEKKFSGPAAKNYVCTEKADGNHDVEQKTYYVDSKGLTIYWKKERKVADGVGNITVLEAGRDIIFQNGTFTTSDPAEQDFLDRYRGCITYDAWELIHVPEKLRTEKAKRENDGMKAQLVESNAELARLRAELEKKTA